MNREGLQSSPTREVFGIVRVCDHPSNGCLHRFFMWVYWIDHGLLVKDEEDFQAKTKENQIHTNRFLGKKNIPKKSETCVFLAICVYERCGKREGFFVHLLFLSFQIKN